MKGLVIQMRSLESSIGLIYVCVYIDIMIYAYLHTHTQWYHVFDAGVVRKRQKVRVKVILFTITYLSCLVYL